MKRRVYVLFVCIGNICRSAMAEAMARKYGSDVVVADSAGTAPALNTHITTRAMLGEIGIDLGDHLPQRLTDVNLEHIDLIVNMSGGPLAVPSGFPVETWKIDDPYGRSEETFRRVRGDIEMRVMDLILRVRLGKLKPVRKSAFAD